MKYRSIVTLALLSLALLLAACTQPPLQVAPEGFVRLSVAVDTGGTASGELTQLGLPYDPNNGSIELEEVRVLVKDRSGQEITFNIESGTYTADADGVETHIQLTEDTSSASVLLPAAGNPYTFESVSYSSRDNAIGYNRLSQHVNVNGTVSIRLKSVLGEASLMPRFPTHYATPGADLDLMLFVAANGHPELQVPISDFTAAYENIEGGELSSATNRGLRIRVADICADVKVEGTVTGIRESAEGFTEDQTSEITPFELECVPASGGTLEVDLEAPSIIINTFNPTTGRIEGEANDNVAIAKVEIYDGPELVASTDDAEVDAGAARVNFKPGTDSFYADLPPTPNTDRGFQAVAFDPAGNEARSAETQNLAFVYVSQDGDDNTATGTKANPFGSIANALTAVNEGGTIFVQDGEYEIRTLNINKSITLRGESESYTILNANRTTGSVPGYGLEVTADYVTLESFTLQGPGEGSNQGRGIHAAGHPVAENVLQGLVIRNVTVDGARQMGLSINTTNGTVLDNVTVKNVNSGDEGIGINLKSSHNALLTNVTTTNNTIGISIETTKTTQEYANNDARNITITGGSHSDVVGLMTEIYDGREITGLTLDPALGYAYAVRNPTPLTARDTSDCSASGAQYTYYVQDLPEALSLAEEFCVPEQTVVQEISEFDAADLLGFIVPEGLSIQAAVDAAAEGATINIAEGTHKSDGVKIMTAALKIVGAGAGSTFIEGNNPDGENDTYDYGFDVYTADVEISGLHLKNYFAGVNLNNAPGAHLHGLEFSDSRIAIRTPTTHTVDGLIFENSSIENTFSGVLIQHGNTNPTPARNVSIDDVTFTNVAHKGIYAEAFTDSTIRNVTMERVANGGAHNDPNQASVALEINLKYAHHGAITLSDIEIQDSGWSNEDAAYDGSAEPTNRNAAALAVAVRDDTGGYVTAPATLDSLYLENITISGAYHAIRLGEAKDLEPGSTFTTGPTTTTLTGLDVENSGGYAISNYTLRDVDATDTANTINGNNVPDDNFDIEADLLHGTSFPALGVIYLAPDSIYAPSDPKDVRKLAHAIDTANDHDIVHVSGVHVLTEVIVLDKPLTIQGSDPDGYGYLPSLDAHASKSGIRIGPGGAGSELRDFQIFNASTYGVELKGTKDDSSVQGVHIENVIIEGIDSYGRVGVKVASSTDASGFKMIGGKIEDGRTGLYIEGQGGTKFDNVVLDGVEINDTRDKAIYAEALSNAVLRNLEIDNAGNTGNPSSNKNGAGISINIVSGPARNITIEYTTVTNSGGSSGGGGAAISLKSASGVTFENVEIIGSNLSNVSKYGSGVGLRIGDPDSPNEPGPQNVSVKGGSIEGLERAVINHTGTDVTLERVTLAGGTEGGFTTVP